MSNRFDSWFDENGPAALVLREYLVPVEGEDGVFFPATYAAQQGADRDREKFQGGYNIDVFSDKSNVCLIDSVGSQANRIEPLFARPGYVDLVPQLVVTFPEAEGRTGLRLNLLHANHRAADAVIRCSSIEMELRSAFIEADRGNSEPLARIAPTSLVFGVWDSRDTQTKRPRLIASTIRAFNVYCHTRSANFLTQMTIDLAKLNILPGADSTDGFANALASKVPGGVQLMPHGFIRRDTTLALSALRRLMVLDESGTVDPERTKRLRRYILGLSLVAITAPVDPFLRQGCNLVPDCSRAREFKIVNFDGTRPDLTLTHGDAVDYARLALAEFSIVGNREVAFEATRAEAKAAAKSEKLKGCVVMEVDHSAGRLRAKCGDREFECVVNAETKFPKGKAEESFESISKGAKLDVELLNGVAVKIVIKGR